MHNVSYPSALIHASSRSITYPKKVCVLEAHHGRARLERARDRNSDILRRLLGVRRSLWLECASVERRAERVDDGTARALGTVRE